MLYNINIGHKKEIVTWNSHVDFQKLRSYIQGKVPNTHVGGGRKPPDCRKQDLREREKGT